MTRRLVRLFYEMFLVALFVVGGGYAIIAVCDEVFARKLKWTKEGELLDMLPLYQMMPGILAAHNAVYVGRKVAGLTGSVVAVTAVALPSIIIFTLMSMGYDFIPLHNPWLASAFVGLRAALTGVILAMLIKTWRKSVIGVFGYAVTLVATVLLLMPGVPAVGVILAAVAGGVMSGLMRPAAGLFRSSLLAPLLFLKYGAVAFGGGYVLVPLYLQDFVGTAAQYLNLPAAEFANLMALTQITPGPIGINAATYFGYRLFGVAGGVIATVCILVPGFFLLSCALASLEKFRENRILASVMDWVRPVTAALMISAFLSFLGMGVWDVSDTPHTSWCTVGSIHFNFVAVGLMVLTILLMLSRKLGIMPLIGICSLTASLLRA